MPIINRIAGFHDEMTAWRRDFHMHPEIAYEEVRTSKIVAEKLASWGIEVVTGLGKTGVVGVLKGNGGSTRAMGLRADMDALPMQEENDFAHKSTVPGKMHGCGHDGHTTMLLGAARYLAETRNFDGTVYFIFQPAEEGGAGGEAMIKDGLLERFPMETVWGMHNWPELPAGEFGLIKGPIMAAADGFEITLSGRGCHAAMPHHGVDPMLMAAAMIQGAQSLVSRNMDPIDSAVVSITKINGGTAFNVVPEAVTMGGTARTFTPKTQDMVEAGLTRIAQGIAAQFGGAAEVTYRRRYPATVNTAAETDFAAEVAAEIGGTGAVHRDLQPCMGSEDFSFMLNERPGNYIWLGQAGGPSACMVHNPKYDFNDAILPTGASYYARLVEKGLPRVA